MPVGAWDSGPRTRPLFSCTVCIAQGAQDYKDVHVPKLHGITQGAHSSLLTH